MNFILKGNKSKNRLLSSPYFYIVSALVLFVIAAIAHIWDTQFKDFILQFTYIHTGKTNHLLNLIRMFGNGAVTGVLAFAFGACSSKKLAWRLGLAMAIMGIMVNTIKPIVGRERPNGRSFVSFPSGDSATGSAFFAPVAAESAILTPAAFALTPAVAILRTLDNYHYLSDIIAGIGFGFLAAGIAFLLRPEKFRFIRSIKGRYLALLAVLMALIAFIPEAIQGNGKSLWFFELYAFSLFLYIFSFYVSFLTKERSDKCKPIPKFLLKIKQHFIPNEEKNSLSFALFNSFLNFAIFKVLLVLISALLIIYAWMPFLSIYETYCLTGGGLGFITLIHQLNKTVKKESFIEFYAMLKLGIYLTVFFFVVCFIPALLIYN